MTPEQDKAESEAYAKAFLHTTGQPLLVPQSLYDEMIRRGISVADVRVIPRLPIG